MASKSYTLLEYLVTIETELKKLKKIVAESVGADYSELIVNIDGIRNELNTFKTSITDTVNTNNSEITSKFNSLESQFITFKTSITNTVNTNNTNILSKVNSLETQFNSLKTSITNINERFTNVENRITTLENSGCSGGSGADVTELQNQVDYLEEQHNYFKNSITTRVDGIENRVTTLESNSGSSSGGGSGGGGSSTQTSSKKLIASYTHTSNKVIQPTGFDTETGVFTCPNHGLTGNEKLMINFNPNEFTTIKVIPYELFMKFNSTTWQYFKPIVSSANTFYLDGFTTFDSSKTGEINVSKFWFEFMGTENITFNNIPDLSGVKEIEIITYNTIYNEFGICLDCLNNTMLAPYRYWQTMNKIELIPYSVEHTFTTRGIALASITKTLIKNNTSHTTVTKTSIPLEAGKYSDNWNIVNANYSFIQIINGDMSYKSTFKLDVGGRANIRNGFKIEIYDTGVR